MNKNCLPLDLALLALVALGCERPDAAAGRYQGVVELDERDLAFEVTGRLRDLLVREGAKVAPGQVVAHLDDEVARAAVAGREADVLASREQLALLRAGTRGEDRRALAARVDAARASERLATENVQRARTLFNQGAATRAALDEAEAQASRAAADRSALDESLHAAQRGARVQELEAAQHRLEAAEAAARVERERLARHELRAQRAGEILAVNVEAGELASAGVPVLTMADPTRPYADVFVAAAEAPGLHAGVEAWGLVDGAPHELRGRLELIARTTEFTPRYLFSETERSNLVVRARVRFDDPGRLLPAGVPVFVRLVRDGRHD